MALATLLSPLAIGPSVVESNIRNTQSMDVRIESRLTLIGPPNARVEPVRAQGLWAKGLGV